MLYGVLRAKTGCGFYDQNFMEACYEKNERIHSGGIPMLTQISCPVSLDGQKVSADTEGENWALEDIIHYLKTRIPDLFTYESREEGTFSDPGPYACFGSGDAKMKDSNPDFAVKRCEDAGAAENSAGQRLKDGRPAISWGKFMIAFSGDARYQNEDSRKKGMLELEFIKEVLTQGVPRKCPFEGTWKFNRANIELIWQVSDTGIAKEKFIPANKAGKGFELEGKFLYTNSLELSLSSAGARGIFKYSITDNKWTIEGIRGDPITYTKVE
jgi:hypothetical protein